MVTLYLHFFPLSNLSKVLVPIHGDCFTQACLLLLHKLGIKCQWYLAKQNKSCFQKKKKISARPIVVKTGSDSSTAKCLAIGVSVTGLV